MWNVNPNEKASRRCRSSIRPWYGFVSLASFLRRADAFTSIRLMQIDSQSQLGQPGIPKSIKLYQSERIGSSNEAYVCDSPGQDGSIQGTTDVHVNINGSTSSTTVAPSGSLWLPDDSGLGQASLRLGQPVPTVWTEFSRLAQYQTAVVGRDIVNLGQGFPDWLPPQFAIDSLVEAALDSAQSPHQYTRTAGHGNLVQQLARRYTAHLRRSIDPMTDVAVTVGASQALYLSLQTLVQPGDEVILFEPFFDLYVNQVKLAGGKPIFVSLDFVPYDLDDPTSGGDWILDPDKLNRAVSMKTKAIILNSPHNPTGKIFTRTEMEFIACSLERAHPACTILSDEVYKYIVHAPPSTTQTNSVAWNGHSSAIDSAADTEPSLFCRGHTHFASLPGMWEKTITISSAGKTFSATGWQIGWCIGPAHLMKRIHQLLPYVQFCPSTVMQEALARSLPRADLPYQGHDSYYDALRDMYRHKRDLLVHALKEVGFGVPNFSRSLGGGFFLFARIGPAMEHQLPMDRVNVPNPAAPGGIARRDWAFCQWLLEEHGVLLIPSSPFFASSDHQLQHRGTITSDSFVRVAFCKTEDTLVSASKALQGLVHPRLQSRNRGKSSLVGEVNAER